MPLREERGIDVVDAHRLARLSNDRFDGGADRASLTRPDRLRGRGRRPPGELANHAVEPF